MSDMKLIMENWRKFQESEAEEQINEAPPEYFGADGTDPMAGLALSAQGRFRDGDIEGGLKDLEAFKKGSEMQGELASLLIPIGGTATLVKYANKLGAGKFVRFLKNIFGKGKPTGAPIKNRPQISFDPSKPFSPKNPTSPSPTASKKVVDMDARQPTYGDSGPSPLSQRISKKQGQKPKIDPQGSTASMKSSPDANARIQSRVQKIDNRQTQVDSEIPAGLRPRQTAKKGSKNKDRKTLPKGSK